MSVLRRLRAFVMRHRLDIAICCGLLVGTVAVLLVTEKQVGFTRDEGYYFKAARQYWGWFEQWPDVLRSGNLSAPFEQANIDRYWSYNHEHPVLMKSLFALSWGIGKKHLGLFSLNSTAFRFPALVFSGLLLALIYLLARALHLARWSSLLAALMFASMPRAFWHFHLACFDIPVTAAHVWLVLAYYKGRRSWAGALVVGLAFGLAATVKHNVLVIPAVFVLHWILVEARGFRQEDGDWRLPPLPASFFSMAIVGPLVFFAHWPYLWPDMLKRAGWYIGFHLTHVHYPIMYFKELLTAPPFPWSFPFVMSLVTVPLVVLTLFFLGVCLAVPAIFRVIRNRISGRDDEVELTRVPLGDVSQEPSGAAAALLLLNAAVPFLLIALPSSPVFGGTKHWMNGLPFLCVLGAWAAQEGVARARAYFESRGSTFRFGPVATAAFCGLVLLPGFVQTARVHPYGLASYNSVTGFARGAANVGFQRTFWGYEPRLALPLINDVAPPRARIAFGDTNHDDYRMYREDGLLRSDIVIGGWPRSSNVASVQPQGEFKEQWMDVLNAWQVRGPDHVVHLEGVPLVTITFRP